MVIKSIFGELMVFSAFTEFGKYHQPLLLTSAPIFLAELLHRIREIPKPFSNNPLFRGNSKIEQMQLGEIMVLNVEMWICEHLMLGTLKLRSFETSKF